MIALALLAVSIDSNSAADACGSRLATDWAQGLTNTNQPNSAQLKIMMYTLSREEADRAVRQLELHPGQLGHVSTMSAGPGGQVITADGPITAWKAAPREWFSRLCTIAADAKSGFVEMADFASDSGEPAFTVRQVTGPGIDGYYIGFGPPPLVPQPPVQQ